MPLVRVSNGGCSEPTGYSSVNDYGIAGGRTVASYNISTPQVFGFAVLRLYFVIFDSEGNQIYASNSSILGVTNGKFSGSTSVSGSASTLNVMQFSFD